MGENTFPMECSDPQYLPRRTSLDYADDNVVRDNAFQDVTYGVRVEDDAQRRRRTTSSRAPTPSHEAIVVGTRFRTSALGLPVDGHDDHRQPRDHRRQPEPVPLGPRAHQHDVRRQREPRPRRGLLRGRPAARARPFVLAVAVVAARLRRTRRSRPAGAAAARRRCRPARSPVRRGAAVSKAEPRRRQARHAARATTRSRSRARSTLPHPFAPALDPVATGVRCRDRGRDGGARARRHRAGRRVRSADARSAGRSSPERPRWTLRATAAPRRPAASPASSSRTCRARRPGLVGFTVKGTRGAYAVDPAQLPLDGLLVLDPPTAETGQCGRAAFPGPAPVVGPATAPSCASDGARAKFRVVERRSFLVWVWHIPPVRLRRRIRRSPSRTSR